MYKYYQLGDVVYWADETTKVAEGSVEVAKSAFDAYMKSIQPPRSWTPLQFLELFSAEKQLQVKQLAMTNAQVGLWYDKLLASAQVLENDQRLQAGLDALVQAGVLTRQDIDNALTPKT